MIIATGAAAMGMEVVMFYTFWGTAALRDPKKRVGGQEPDREDVRHHAPQGPQQDQALEDADGRAGHRDDQGHHEEEERREPRRDDSR